jgi:hypothetical protein
MAKVHTMQEKSMMPRYSLTSHVSQKIALKVFNLETKSVVTPQGKYQISVDFGDGTKKSILISLVDPTAVGGSSNTT